MTRGRDFKNSCWPLKEKGMTILLIEHNMKLVMDVADEIVVLDFGRKLAEGNCDEISCNRKVIEAYLGSDYVNIAGGNHSGDASGATISMPPTGISGY